MKINDTRQETVPPEGTLKAPAKDTTKVYIYTTDLICSNLLSPKLNGSKWDEPCFYHKLLYTTSLIFHLTFVDKSLSESKNGYVNIHFHLLGQTIGKKYVKPCLDELKARGIIESDDTYARGEKSIGYRIAANFRGPCKRITLVSPYIAASLARNREKRLKEAKEANQIQNYVASVLDRLSFGPDAEEMIEKLAFSSFEEGASWMMAYDAIKEKRWFLSEDKKTGRIFNPVSSMPSALRALLRLDGHPLIELDIKNAQPLFLAALYPKTSIERGVYVGVVESGRFYESLHERSGLKGLSRDEFKREVFIHVIFGRRCFDPNRSYMGGVERGEENISILTLLKLSVVLKAKPSTLLGRANL